jgi:hypothetical protein
MKMKLCAALGAGLLSVAAVAADFVDWKNVEDKNLLSGLALTPSDLRHRAVVYVVVDDAWLTPANVANLAGLASAMPNPPAAFAWDIQDLVIKKIAVVSVRNSKGGATAFAEKLKAPKKGGDKTEDSRLSKLRTSRLPFYKDVAPVGEAELTAEQLPYVAVYAPDSAEPVFKAEKFDFASMKDVRKAVNDAAKKFPTDWTWPLGVREPQHCKTLPALVAKGKTAKDLQAALKPSLKSDDPEVAKEAQLISDAISQYGTMLKLRIALEYAQAPARAYYDAAQLVKMFPSEKKKIAAVDAKLKAMPEASSLGKLMEKLMNWSRPDFAPKSKGEAKKIVAELQKAKKILAELAQSKNTHIQGEAMLISSQLDTLIDVIPTKVP